MLGRAFDLVGSVGIGEKLAICSDQEKLQAQDQRAKARQEVLDERNAKRKIFTDSLLSGSDFLSFYTTELTWWDNHPSLCPLDIQTRITQFREKVQEREPTLRESLWSEIKKLEAKEAQLAVDKLPEAIRVKVQEDLNALRNATAPPKDEVPTVWTDALASAKIALIILIPITWILLGIRVGSFAANDILYKPLAYRILTFIYTFAGAPIFAVYYFIRWFYGFIMDDVRYTPRFEGIFPVQPYTVTEGEPISLYNRFFGYQDTPELRKWMEHKRAEEQGSWMKALESTDKVLADILKAKEEANKLK